MIEYITSGESHGKGMAVTIQGIPSRMEFDIEFINQQLARRQMGYGRGGRMKIERDKIDVIAGVRDGFTTGSPITLVVWNKDWENWKNKKTTPIHKARPGHADLIGAYKYQHTDDMRHILERSSARETAARVAGSAISRMFLKHFGIEIFSHVVQWNEINIFTEGMSFAEIRKISENSELGCACDPDTEQRIKTRIDEYADSGNTMGGVIETVIFPCPPMLGSYQIPGKKLDAEIASAIISIQAIKGIEFGAGFAYSKMPGQTAHDEIFYDDKKEYYYRKTNHAGGIEGGMSNGNPIIFRSVMKPIPTQMTPLNTVNIHTKQPEKAVKERSDVTAVPAAGVVIENVVSVVIANAIMERYGSDNMEMILRHFHNDPAVHEFNWKGVFDE